MKQAQRPNPMAWILVLGVVLLAVVLIIPRPSSTPEVQISRVIELARAGDVAAINVDGDDLTIRTKDGRVFESRKEESISALELLTQNGIDPAASGIAINIEKESVSFGAILLSVLPILFIIGFLFYILRASRKTGVNQAFDFGRSRAKLVAVDHPTVTFKDVAGVEEAKQELAEIVEFLRYPEKFTEIGARIPKGVLLIGPPGTGKTLISRAIAGEAGVRFFSISGSEFVELFVGVGASRVRDLFKNARQMAPAIIFIDEIDAVGRHRGAGIGGGNDEREQTLNQILVEMDGFDERTNVIVIAATNRPDVLDPALLRPGRFDRRVVLDLPHAQGREAILRVHMRGKPLDADVDVVTLAKQTHGFSGADLANVVNEAAILAAREHKRAIGLHEFEEAIDRVAGGPATRSRKVSEKERAIVAYHEAGHALVAACTPKADPVHKVTIVPRGRAGGYTKMLPEEDRSLWTKGQFEAILAVMMGGKTSEEVVFGDSTTGAANDLQNASLIARKMVTEYGMSERLGPASYQEENGAVFLGKELVHSRNYSNAVAEAIDEEVSLLLRKAQETARRVIAANRDRLARLAEQLLAVETLDGPQLEELLAGPCGQALAPA